MKAQELSGAHLGATIGVEIGGAWCRDVLSGVNHEADILTSQTFLTQQTTYDLGRKTTYLTFLRFGSVRVGLDTPVELITEPGTTDYPQSTARSSN